MAEISDSMRRLIEVSSPELSDSAKRLIKTMDVDPEATFRRYEERGINTGRLEFVDNYVNAQRRKSYK